PSPHTPLPPTSTEFAQHLLAGLPGSVRPSSTGEIGAAQPPQPSAARPSTPPQPTSIAQAEIHSDRVGRPDEPAFSSNSSLATHHSPLTTRHFPQPTPHIPFPQPNPFHPYTNRSTRQAPAILPIHYNTYPD